MIANISVELWNGLPSIVVKENGENVRVIYTNINNEFMALRVKECDAFSSTVMEEAKKARVFECLNNLKPYRSEEFTAIFSLTEKCNSSCRYCFLDARHDGLEMSGDMIGKGIDLAYKIADGRRITFAIFGGEPSVAPQLIFDLVSRVEMRSKADREKARFAVTTNGIMPNHLIDYIVAKQFKVSVSMDGCQDVQDYQRPLANGRSSFNEVIRTIKKIVEGGLDHKIRVTVTAFSVNRMTDAVKMFADLGVKKVHFEPVSLGGRGCNNIPELQMPSVSEFVSNLIDSIEEGAKRNVDIICFPYMNMLIAPVVFCDGNINNRIVFNPSGAISSCIEIQDINSELFPALGLGQYDFSSQEYQIMYDQRRPLHRGKDTVEAREECKTCSFKFFCGGGCPTRNFRGSGSTNVVDEYRCSIVRGIMPYILYRFYIATFLKKGGDVRD